MHQWDVHFWSAAELTRHSYDLERHNINVLAIQINDSHFNNMLQALSPQIVIFDRFISEEQFGWRVGDVCPDSLRVVNLEDLHGIREGRLLAYKQSLNDHIPSASDIFTASQHDYLFNPKTLRELASIYRSDLSITLSDAECEWLQSSANVPSEHVLHLPFIRDNSIATNPDFAERNHIVFIGNMLHKPNQLAVDYIITHLWGPIRKALPDYQLMIYGEYATAKYKQLHRPRDGIFMHGYTDDHLSTIASAKLLLAPLQVGAGVKGKLIDAMTQGTPSITTPIGVEGIPHTSWPGAVCTNPDEMVNAAIRLMKDRDAWEYAASHCQPALLKSGVSLENAETFMTRIETSLERLQILRQRNSVQKVIMQQSLQASRYLSKWIMLKNASE